MGKRIRFITGVATGAMMQYLTIPKWVARVGRGSPTNSLLACVMFAKRPGGGSGTKEEGYEGSFTRCPRGMRLAAARTTNISSNGSGARLSVPPKLTPVISR